MPNSPLVSVRIPPEILERLDQLAQQLYPPRRPGGNANRSQVILDAIEQFLQQYDSPTELEIHVEDHIEQVLKEYQKQLEKEIQEYINEKFLAYAYNLEHRLQLSRKSFPKSLSTS
jgi:metal-responsive CopG/Arc/MetJ family transcriptional regulator